MNSCDQEEDSVQLLKSDIDDYSREESRSPKPEIWPQNITKAVDLTPLRIQSKRSGVINPSSSAQVFLEKIITEDNINPMKPEIESMVLLFFNYTTLYY